MRMEQQEDQSASEKILDVLREGRANPLYLRERTDLSKQRVNRVLNRLQAQGRIKKVCQGLYELDPSDEFGAVGEVETDSAEMELECPHPECDHVIEYTLDGESVSGPMRVVGHVVREHPDYHSARTRGMVDMSNDLTIVRGRVGDEPESKALRLAEECVKETGRTVISNIESCSEAETVTSASELMRRVEEEENPVFVLSEASTYAQDDLALVLRDIALKSDAKVILAALAPLKDIHPSLRDRAVTVDASDIEDTSWEYDPAELPEWTWDTSSRTGAGDDA